MIVELVTLSHLYSLVRLLFALLVFATVCYVLNKLRQYMEFVRKIDKIAGPPPRSALLGNLSLLTAGQKQGCDPGESALQLLCFGGLAYAKDGMTRFWVGPVPLIALFTAENCEPLLSSNVHIDKAVFYDWLHSWLGLGLLTSSGEKWRRHRKMLTTSFHFKILEDFLPIITHQTSVFIEHLEKARTSSKSGVIEDISRHILMCALDTICETAMGIRLDTHTDPENKYVHSVHQAGVSFMDRMAKPWLLSDLIFYRTAEGREYTQCVKTLHDFTSKVLKAKKEKMRQEISEDKFSEKKRMPFMDTLIHQHLKDPTSLSEHDIREEVDTFMFEGHDTTGWAITWTTYLLGLHPDIQDKVQEELDTVFGTDPDVEKPFSMDSLRELKYLECVIKETLRLFPSVPFYGRMTSEPLMIQGVKIPAGTAIGAVAYVVHRDPKHWLEPEKFIPERFLPENCNKMHPFAYIPFSAGPRNCIGQKFAVQEEKAILASLFRRYKVISLLPRDKLRITAALILKSQDPIPVKLERRHSSNCTV